MLKLLLAIAAFCDGFFYGLSESARQKRSIPLLEAAPTPLLLPPAREPIDTRLTEYIEAEFFKQMDYAPDADEAIPLPEMSRADLVCFLLDEAWAQGKSTYSELIDYVKAQSGEGCSRRAVSNWKKARKLNGDQEQAA